MYNLNDLIKQINQAFANQANLSPQTAPKELRKAVDYVIHELGTGELRVASPKITIKTSPKATLSKATEDNIKTPRDNVKTPENNNSNWIVNQWVKKAILLYFKITENKLTSNDLSNFYDKINLKFTNTKAEQFAKQQVRVVPPACIREGAYIGPNTVIMPSYINIGAYVGANTMIDTWATVGSSAQIGDNVHISGGVGIGGVLEPLQANPTIIEDDCFIGARSEIVEGVIIERGSVISMGVFIGNSTKIYDRRTDQIIYGRVPAGSVVVPGTLPAENGKYSLYSAIIVKQVDARTKSKTAINQILRENLASQSLTKETELS